MFIYTVFQFFLMVTISGCIVEEDTTVKPSSSSEAVKQKESSKQVVGSAQPDIRAVKVEVSLFESVQLNPILAKLAHQKGKDNSPGKVCRWSRVTNTMKQTPVTVFPEPCADLVQSAWHPEQVGISLVSQGKNLYEVSGAEASPLSGVPGRPFDLGINAAGTMLVRTVQADLTTEVKNGARGVALDNEFIRGGSQETASVYRSYQYRDASWQLISQQASDPGTAPERSEIWAAIGPTSTDLHPGVHEIDYSSPTEEILAELKTTFPEATDESSEWVVGTYRDIEYAWQLAAGDKITPSLPIVVKNESGQWARIPGLKYKTPTGITMQFRDNYLMVTRMGTRPYVVDLTTKKIVYKSVNTTGVIFWPRLPGTKNGKIEGKDGVTKSVPASAEAPEPHPTTSK